MHEVLVNRLGRLSLPRKSAVRLTDRPDMTLDVYRGRKQQIKNNNLTIYCKCVHAEQKFLTLADAFFVPILIMMLYDTLSCTLRSVPFWWN